MKKILTGALGLALMAVACNTLGEPEVQYGEISVSLGEPDVEVVTRAAETLDPSSADAADYTVRILNSSGVEQYKAKYNVFETQRLPLGDYYVTAENCSEAEAEQDNGQMRLFGESAVLTLSADNLSQTVRVDCEVVNSRVAVVFDSTVENRFEGLKVVLAGASTGRSVTVGQTASGVETETWFNPQTVNYTISGRFTQLGKDIKIEGSRTLAAKNNIKLVVKLNLSNGQLLPVVTVNKDIDNPSEIPGEFNPYN